jgi:ubiquinone/menaquinone biosynthesis C-methylase UbiE
MNNIQNKSELSKSSFQQNDLLQEESDKVVASRKGYWDSFYSNDKLIRQQPPSQFAAFVASEFNNFPMIVDVGCGNGRDTLFFAQLGYSTLGIDRSSAAIAQSTKKILGSDDNSENHKFICMNVTSLPYALDLIDFLSLQKKIIYSRFFLHAITDEEQKSFLDFTYLCMKQGDILALEFRTTEDENRQTVTSAHYRRYIDTSQLVKYLSVFYDLDLDYYASGTGFAKYLTDDAHVAQILLRKK